MGMQKGTWAAILLCVTVCFCSPKIAHGFDSYSSDQSMKLNAVQLAGIPRDLQLLGFDVSSWNELWDYVLRECRGYLSNTTHGNEVDTYRLALCLKAAMQELLGECFGNFPGVWDPIHCTFESFFSEEFVQTIFEVVEWADGNYTNSTNGNYTNSTNSSIDWTDLIDVAGNYTNSTTGNYTNSTNSSYDWMDLVEVFQNYTNSTNGNYTNSTNSSYDLRDLLDVVQFWRFYDYSAVLAPLQNLNSETCEVLFGTRDHPNFHACLHLFGEEDLTPFVQAAANGFKGTKGCSKLRDTLNLGSRAFGKVSKVPKGYFNGFRQNFATCAKFDDGMLGKALTDQFVTGNAASTHLTLVVLILSALTAFVLM